jgi:hypothetical protein
LDLTRSFFALCLRGRRDPAALEAARDLSRSPDFDWATVLSASKQWFLGPLLYAAVRGQGFVPPQVEQALRDEYDFTARRNVWLFHQLAEVLACLRSAGSGVIVLKGAALVQMVYGGNVALRPLRDLDLLIRPEVVAEAQRLLGAMGYVSVRAETRAGAMLDYENEVTLFKPGSVGVLLELHWSLIDSPFYQRTLSGDWFWHTAQPLAIGSERALALGVEAQLLHLCAHLRLHHAGQELLWLNDVAEVLYAYQQRIDWAVLLQQAQALALVLPTQQVLAQVAGELNAPVPEAVLAQLSELRATADEAQAYSRLAVKNRSVARRLWDDLAALPGWRARLRFAWSNLFPSWAYMRRRYHIAHPWLLALYYPYRWWLGLRSGFT